MVDFKDLNSDDIVFFKYTWDWRNEIHNCTVSEFLKDNEEKETVQIPTEDIDKIRATHRLMKKYNQHLVKAHYKNEDESVTHMIDWKDFDPFKMEVVDYTEDKYTVYENNILDIIKSKKAPGMFMKTDDTRGSIMHHDKIDEGAIGDLIDKGLDGAIKRADQRQKETGHAFSKNNKNRFVRRKKNVRRKGTSHFAK